MVAFIMESWRGEARFTVNYEKIWGGVRGVGGPWPDCGDRGRDRGGQLQPPGSFVAKCRSAVGPGSKCLPASSRLDTQPGGHGFGSGELRKINADRSDLGPSLGWPGQSRSQYRADRPGKTGRVRASPGATLLGFVTTAGRR